MNRLQIVQTYFPEVKKVRLNRRRIRVKVIARDAKGASPKSHTECALARCCKRQLHVGGVRVDGAVVSSRSLYLKAGEEALCCSVPESVAREMTALDRLSKLDPATRRKALAAGAGFASGEYTFGPARKYKYTKSGRAHGPQPGPDSYRHRPHHTEGLRTRLGTK